VGLASPKAKWGNCLCEKREKSGGPAREFGPKARK
jgi:hypothetical protein